MKIVIKNARLSYPALFKPTSFEGQPPKFGASLILDRKANAGDIRAVENAIAAIVKDEFKGNEKVLKHVCLKDGAEKVDNDTGEFKDGYGPDVMFITSKNKDRPRVVNRKKVDVTPEDTEQVPYAGCYVNAVIVVKSYSHKDFGKGISAYLSAIQFVKDGEPFGESHVNVDEVFDDLGDEDAEVSSMLD